MKHQILRTLIGLGAIAALVIGMSVQAQTESGEPKTISPGSTVSIEFTIYLEDGSTFGSTDDTEPFTYEQGQGQIPPGLEEALVGLKADDHKKVTLAPEDAYGPVNPEAFVDVQIDRIPEEARNKGARLMVRGPNGSTRTVKVHEVREDVVVIDLNHPLAGKSVTFDVRVLTVE